MSNNLADGQDRRGLVFEAMRELGLNQRETAELVGCSLRTVQRWSAGSWPWEPHVARIAQEVHPRRPELAAALAQSIGGTLESLGIVKPAPVNVVQPPPPPRIPPQAVAYIVDGLMFRLAEELKLDREVIARTLVNAVARATHAGLSVDELLGALQGKPPQA